MTEDRALKNAIRRRMDDTGEKYTEARRAVLGGAATAASAPLYVEEAQRLEHRHTELREAYLRQRTAAEQARRPPGGEPR